MKKQYWYIILTYILVQVSAFPYFLIMKWLGFIQSPMTQTELSKLSGTWTIISFCIGLIIILLILRTVPKASLRNEAPASIGSAIAWIIGGFFLSLFAQSIAGAIEQYAFGIGRESENTQNILSIMDAVPWLVIVIALIGPILEEIIFRKIIFGVIYEKRISSLEHLPVQWFSLLYIMIFPISCSIPQWALPLPFYMRKQNESLSQSALIC